jgi:hypothetical protein
MRTSLLGLIAAAVGVMPAQAEPAPRIVAAAVNETSTGNGIVVG